MEREECLESNSVRLSGTLTLPDEVGASFPACLFIGGGLPQTRDGDLDLAHTERFPIPLPQRRLFRDEADLLRQIGIASFRYDKRGCGKSTGDFNRTGLFDLLTDACHALHWMRCLPELDPRRIGLIGQSEGAIIALGLAAADSAIPFIVLQGGPYQDLKAILQWQAEAFWRQEEATIDGLKHKVPVLYWVYRQWQAINDSIDRGDTFFTVGDAAWSLELYLPWFREHYTHPPSQWVGQVKCPVLLLHGEVDHNVPATDAKQLQAALVAAGNTDVTLYLFPGLDHSFRRLGDPKEDFITAMQRPLDPVMPEALTSWLRSKIKDRRT